MKKMKNYFGGIFALFVAAFIFNFVGIDADAYGTITQSAQTQNSIVINWTKPETNITGYYLGYSTDWTEAKAMAQSRAIALPTTATSYTLGNLAPGQEYSVYIFYEYRTRYGSDDSYLSGDVKTLPGVVTGLNQEQWYKWALSVHITWDKQPGVDGYEYRFMDHKGNDIDHSVLTSGYSTFLSESIKNDRIYTGTVRAFSTINGVTYYSDWCPTAYFMTQPAKKKGNTVYAEVDAKVSGGKLTVAWGKVEGLDGYNVYVASSQGGKFKKVASLKKNGRKVTIKKIGKKKFKSNKMYYVYVEGYKKAGGQTFTTGRNYITTVRGRRVSYIYSSSWDY